MSGTFNGCDIGHDSTAAWTGAFRQGDDSSGSINNNGSFVIEALTSFSATRSSSVYGKSQHVQPRALYALTIIKS